MSDDDGEIVTVQDVYDSMTEKKKRVLHLMVGWSIEYYQERVYFSQPEDRAIYRSFSELEKAVAKYLCSEARKQVCIV